MFQNNLHSSTYQNAFSLKLAFQALKRRKTSNLLVIQARGALIFGRNGKMPHFTFYGGSKQATVKFSFFC